LLRANGLDPSKQISEAKQKEVLMHNGSGVRHFFENNWEKMVLWAILIGLFYLLRPFFLLIFETFLITYITKGIVERIANRMNVNYKLATVFVFVLFVGLLGMVGSWVGPKLVVESNRILSDFAGDGDQQTRDKINQFVEKIVVNVVGEEKAQAVIESKEYAATIVAIKKEAREAFKASLPRVFDILLKLVKLGWEIAVSLLLAIIFSFILVMDARTIACKMKALETSRIRTFYMGAGPHLAAFGTILGKALRAQAIIAVCNTVLTAAGLWFFDVPNIAVLSVIVFFCGFIPIVGTFLSSIPIVLFGVQAGGVSLAFKLIALIAIVHAVEAYILNPRITANILHMHPILVLVLLLIGERFFGIWGMVVGVPIGYYIISVLTKKDEDMKHDIHPQTPA
jgi:predicted PurR-regulated permease PerM